MKNVSLSLSRKGCEVKLNAATAGRSYSFRSNLHYCTVHHVGQSSFYIDFKAAKGIKCLQDSFRTWKKCFLNTNRWIHFPEGQQDITRSICKATRRQLSHTLNILIKIKSKLRQPEPCSTAWVFACVTGLCSYLKSIIGHKQNNILNCPTLAHTKWFSNTNNLREVTWNHLWLGNH